MDPDHVRARRLAWRAALAGIALAAAVLGCRGRVGTASGSGSAGSGVTGSAGTGGAPTGAGGAGGATTISGPLVPGRAPLRRLTRVEYNNTVLRLLGDPSNPALQFEPDTLADGFTNNADTQNVGTNLAQQYLLAAETLSV